MSTPSNRGFTVNIKLDYIHDPSADDYILKNPKDMMSGSHWQVSISEITDAENRVLNQQSAYAIDQTVRTGGLKVLLDRFTRELGRFLDQNGLPKD